MRGSCAYHSPAMPVPKFTRRVDPRKLAGRAARLAGEVPLEALPRVTPLLTCGEREDTVSARLDFETDARGRVYVSGEIKASLTLLCQRCLEPVRLPVSSSFRVAVRPASVDGVDPQGFDSFDGGDEGLLPAELLEEELLLALPFAPRHNSVVDCGKLAQRRAGADETGPAAASGQDKETAQAKRPFAVLKDLKLD